MIKKQKLVIKVNYDTDNRIDDEQLMPEMREQWNIKTIVIAMLILLIAVSIFLYDAFFKSNSLSLRNKSEVKSITHKPYYQEQEEAIKPQITNLKPEKEKIISKQLATKKSEQDKGNKKTIDLIVNKVNENITPIESRLSKYVIRAQLTNLVRRKEPQDLISPPIFVGEDNSRILYYFTELKDMAGKTVYHDWIYNGKNVFRKQIIIKGNRWRAATQKKLNGKFSGDWIVKLTDSKGYSLHQISFKVIKQ